MSGPLVSVILPVFNGEAFLLETLQSVFRQDYSPLEVIVVDDGSADGSGEICEAFSGLRYIHQQNQGVAMARNRAIEDSTGEFLAFLDQDDRFTPDKISKQVSYLVDHPEIDFVLANEHLFLEGEIERPSWLKSALLENDHAGYHLGTALIRRTAFDAVGLFDPQYRIGSDSDWFFRAKDAGLASTILTDVLLLKRVHGKNESAHVQQSSQDLLRQIRQSLKRRKGRLQTDD